MTEQRLLRLLLLKMSNLSLQDTRQGSQCGLGHETASLFSSLGWEVGEERSIHFHGTPSWASRLYRLDENAGPSSPAVFSELMHLVREGNGSPLQDSCLENPMDGGAWWAAVHGVAKSPTRLNDFTFTFHFHALETKMETHSSVPACRIPGTLGCRLWGRTGSDTTEAT